jgi:hypothetical protein
MSSNTNKIVKNGDFMGFRLSPNDYTYAVHVPNVDLFPNWTFSNNTKSNQVLQNGNGGFTPGLNSDQQCLVIQQGSEASINVNQNVELKYSGKYVLTFENRHRNQDGNGNTYYDPRQRMFVTLFMNESPSVIPILEQDCTPQFSGNVGKWETKTYNFEIPRNRNGTFTLRFKFTMPSTTTPGTSLFVRMVNITYLPSPKPTPPVKSCDTFIDRYMNNLISSPEQQSGFVNDKNSYSTVFSDNIINSNHNPVSEYYSFRKNN